MLLARGLSNIYVFHHHKIVEICIVRNRLGSQTRVGCHLGSPTPWCKCWVFSAVVTCHWRAVMRKW